MGKGDVLWDIGANIGVYSLYAGLNPGVRVVAFEPVANTYYVLNRSIALNHMQDRISALCIGISDRTGISRIFLRQAEAGSSGHALEAEVNARGGFTSVDSQACHRRSGGGFRASFPHPH